MKPGFWNFLLAMSCVAMLTACASAVKQPAQEEQQRASGEILIVTSHSMNASSNNAQFNSGMGGEVDAFAGALRRELGSNGYAANYLAIQAGPDGQRALSSALGARPGAYSHMAQIFWSFDDKSNVFLVATVLPITYSGPRAKFGKEDLGRRYFFAGKGIEPTKTSTELGKEFYLHLKASVLPSPGPKR